MSTPLVEAQRAGWDMPDMLKYKLDQSVNTVANITAAHSKMICYVASNKPTSLRSHRE
jgi:hypothetical protein